MRVSSGERVGCVECKEQHVHFICHKNDENASGDDGRNASRGSFTSLFPTAFAADFLGYPSVNTCKLPCMMLSSDCDNAMLTAVVESPC